MIKHLFLSLSLLLTLVASTEYEEAYAIYKKGDFKTSLIRFQELATEEDDYDAAYILGYMYEHGEGCKVDLENAQKWYKFSSHGYYWQNQPDPSRDINKETRKLFNSINASEDKETRKTIEQYAKSMYSFKAHGSNYFLPISYRYNGVYPETNGHQAKEIETEFQISIKYDYAANFLGLNEIYSIGYTQQSFWQLYEKSAYFRETNYNPELFITLPVGYIKKFDYLKAIRFGFEHKSNGRGGEYERSWNYVTGKFYFQTGFIFTELQFWKDVGSLEYNTDLMEYMGYGQVKFLLPYKKHLMKLISRNSFSKYRATEVNYSYPLSDDNDLFLYIKAFTGYGESLIDYNHNVNKIGIGFSISR